MSSSQHFSVRDQAEQKAIGKAGHLMKRKRKNPNLIVGVMGCMAQNRGEALLDSLPDLDLVIGTQKFLHSRSLSNMIATMRVKDLSESIVDLAEELDSQNTIKAHLDDKSQITAFVSIMQGCNMNCAYCIIQRRGEWSEPDQWKQLSKKSGLSQQRHP